MSPLSSKPSVSHSHLLIMDGRTVATQSFRMESHYSIGFHVFQIAIWGFPRLSPLGQFTEHTHPHTPCIHLCTHACTHACMHTHTHTRTQASMYACAHSGIHLYIRAYTQSLSRTCTQCTHWSTMTNAYYTI